MTFRCAKPKQLKGLLWKNMALTTGIRTLDDLELENKIVFVRTDLDSPVSKSGALLDDSRVALAVPVLKTLQQRGARVVVGSRFGDTARAPKKSSPSASLEPAAAALGRLAECEVFLPDSCTGDAVKKVLMDLRPTQICVLENLASEDDRGKQSEAFARQLEAFVDVYVADSVRALDGESATTTLLPRLLEERAASPSMMRELSAIDRISSRIDNPRTIIWGGNGLSARLDLLHTLAGDDARVLFCGVAANTLLRAQGGAVGRSAIEEEYLAGARTLAERLGNRMVLPLDLECATSPKADRAETRAATRIPETEMALDLGPETRRKYAEIIDASRTAIWCGTIGFHKSETFSLGTRTICEAFARTSAFTLVAGDDSVAAARAALAETLTKMDCVARGGQATLALLNENKLAGLEALRGIS